MKYLNKLMSSVLFLLILTHLTAALTASQLIFIENSGTLHDFEFDSHASFNEVINSIKRKLPQDEYQNASPLQLFAVKAMPPAAARHFSYEINASHAADIRYVLDFLANASLFKIATSKQSIQKITKKLDHLHPFKVLAFIFTDSTLLANLHKIKDRSLVWEELFKEYCQSLDEESNFSNLFPHLNSFGAMINLYPNYLQPAIRDRNWDEFFNVLLSTHPSP